MNNEDTMLRGFRKITDSKDGGLGEVTNDWPGICAMLLRKIIRDMYIGKGKEGFMQWQDENITYPQWKNSSKSLLNDTMEVVFQMLN